tara:strand:- start:17 stop:481 length:465 start_codon:yes stop_codon:yes gene_type:complete
MEDIWGLSLNSTIILSAILLIVIDAFFSSEILTLIGYVVLSSLVWFNLEQHFLIKLLLSIIAFALCIAFHYLLWRSLIKKAVDAVAPTKYDDSFQKYSGQKGVIRVIDGKIMVELKNGELWPCIEKLSHLTDGTLVEIELVKDGYVDIKSTFKD